MKIVGFVIQFVLLGAVLAPNFAFAKATCKGNLFTKLDNGQIAFERVQFVPTDSFQQTLSIQEIKGRPYFNFDKKSDEWTYYTYIDHEQMWNSGFRRQRPGLDYSDFNFNKESFFKFKDQAIFGFKLLCRMSL